MKRAILLLCLVLSSCAQLTHDNLQPVVAKSLKEKIYFTTCSGVVETIGTCHDKAKHTCQGSFEVIKRYETPTGGHRELTFQCKG